MFLVPVLSFAQPGPGMMWRGSGGWISVHLGPSWYLENQDIKLGPKDKGEVKGARVTFAGKPAIIAAEVKKGDQVLTLRDEAGFPVWAGWRSR